jgi:hypothetical protein
VIGRPGEVVWLSEDDVATRLRELREDATTTSTSICVSMPPAVLGSSSRKDENEGGPGVADVARLLRTVMPPRVAEDAVWRFLEALACTG